MNNQENIMSILRKLAGWLLIFLFPLALLAEDKPCSSHPKIIGEPFIVHGRLSLYNGAPSVRLWKIGTNRILGVSEGRFYVEGIRNLPEAIEEKLTWDTELYGDFLVYPFTPSKPGVMQLMCIESVKNLVIKKKQNQ